MTARRSADSCRCVARSASAARRGGVTGMFAQDRDVVGRAVDEDVAVAARPAGAGALTTVDNSAPTGGSPNAWRQAALMWLSTVPGAVRVAADQHWSARGSRVSSSRRHRALAPVIG